jgi:hypothetical protein
MPNPNEVTVSQVNGQWQCSPDPIKPTGLNAIIKFTLATGGYAFRATNAIVVQSPGTQFPDPSETKDATTAKLKDRNDERGQFKYSVFLTQDGTGSTVEIDPIINNDERP